MAKKKPPSREHRTVIGPRSIKAKDWLRFVQLDLFEECWRSLGLNDEDLQALEIAIMLNPDGNPVIKDTGGVRKIRFSGEHWNYGKRKGARVYYIYVPAKGLVLLAFVHVKDSQEVITAGQKKEIRAILKEILAAFDA